GWALAFVQYSKTYVPDEAAAREARRGIWSGAFIAPWDWRHRNQKTVVLGAIAVPINAQAELLAPASAMQAPSIPPKAGVTRSFIS
ncbi:MAG: thermonuclease family protein, partial [Xanthobacteraceae bacterium]